MTAPPPRADGPVDAAGERRAALLLAALRLSRDPALLPRFEAAVSALDDDRRPEAGPRGAERALLRRLGERLAETLAPADAAAWEAELGAEAAAGAAEMRAWRRAQGRPAAGEGRNGGGGGAARAAGELQARQDGGEALAVPGARTAEGWTAVALLELEGEFSWLPADLWALLPPGGDGALAFAFAAEHAARVRDWPAALAEVHARRGELAEASASARAAAAGAEEEDAAAAGRGGR